MKAAIIEGAGATPKFGDFTKPAPTQGSELVSVRAAALTHLTKSRASGAHYSSDAVWPVVPGVDGVGITQDGRRVYFVMPEAPFGAMAETTLVRAERCIELPAGLDDVTAAAIANPGMSAWAALAERALLKPGETVLVNGATGIAGRLAVQIAKHLGAAKVIASGRDVQALEELRALGADVVIPFQLGSSNPHGAKVFESSLKHEFALGIDVVVDYLWGESALTVMTAIAKAVEDAKPVRFIQVGSASGDEIQLPGAALRSSSLVLMGSGLKSVPMAILLAAIGKVFAAVVPAGLRIVTKAVPLAEVEKHWNNDGKARLVFVVG